MFSYTGFHPKPRPSKVPEEGNSDREDTCEARSGGGQDSNAVYMLDLITNKHFINLKILKPARTMLRR